MSQLKGKMYWVVDDFAYNGMRLFKKDETAHFVSGIENAIIDEHTITFTVLPLDVAGTVFNYKVSLLPDNFGNGFTGKFDEASDPEWTGNVKCDVFSNDKQYLLYGTWMEAEMAHTFWAIIDKEK
jgi:hypothetical protein